MTRDEFYEKVLRVTHYQVLGVSRTATLEEIKAAHRQLALQHHPDKAARTTARTTDDSSRVGFLHLQQAWECLRDSTSRQAYDMELLRREKHETSRRQAAMPLLLSDMEVGQDEHGTTNVYVHSCRCGDEVHVWQDELSELLNDCVVAECPGCSFAFSITNDKGKAKHRP